MADRPILTLKRKPPVEGTTAPAGSSTAGIGRSNAGIGYVLVLEAAMAGVAHVALTLRRHQTAKRGDAQNGP